MKQLFPLLLLLLIATSCYKKADEQLFDTDIYIPSFTSNFRIQSIENSENVMISSLNPWQDAENVVSRLLIVRDSVIPHNLDIQILKGNAQRIICMSSTHIAMIDALDKTERIVGVSGFQYISNPKIISRSDIIPDVGYEGNIDYEAIIKAKPDLILLFSINGASAMEAKLKELGIPYIYIGDYLEENPLGKAEWIVAISEILGIREKGIEKFNSIVHNYTHLKHLVDSVVLESPKVMVNAPFLDSWFMPSTKSYIATMIKDAGGEYIYRKNTGNASNPIDLEEALKLVSEADYWINIGTVNSIEELKVACPAFLSAECVKQGRLYNNNHISSPGGGNDCYESGVVNPDLILKDMIKIFHPQLIEENFTYYHKLK